MFTMSFIPVLLGRKAYVISSVSTDVIYLTRFQVCIYSYIFSLKNVHQGQREGGKLHCFKTVYLRFLSEFLGQKCKSLL